MPIADYLAGYMPHGHCLTWDPWLLWPTVLADGLIALAYLALSVCLFWALRTRVVTKRWRWSAFAFGAFILLCGCTHVSQIVLVWVGAYWVHAALSLARALVSGFVAVLVGVELLAIHRAGGDE